MALIRKFRDIIEKTQPNDQTTILADRLNSENLGGVNYHVNNGPNGSNTPSSLNVSNSYHGGSDRPLIPSDVTFSGGNINVSFLDNEIKGTEEIYKRYLKNEVMENSTMNEEEFEKLLDEHQNQSVYERVDGGLKVYTINNEFFNGYVDSNIFKNSSSYYARFYNAITAAKTKLTEPVSETAGLKLGNQGFNAAQYWGSRFFKPRIKLDNNTEDPYNPSGSYRAPTDTEDLINSILTGEFLNPDSRRLDEIIDDIPDDLDELEAASQRIVKAYVPGLNREPQPFYAKNGLQDFLKQNILTRYGYLDKDSARAAAEGRNAIDGVGRSGRLNSIDNVFKQLYTNNNSAPYYEYYANNEEVNKQNQWNKGAIAQVAISEIERSGGKEGEEVFSFEKDADLLNYAAKVQGFSNNIADSVPQDSNPDAKGGDELPAVEEIKIDTNASGTRLQKYDEYITQLGDRQYFPFLFETENRSKVEETKKEQVCQFQATIDNINETFNPNWTSKAFFGRTEQVNTYMQTDRSLSMSFTIFANTIRQLQNVYERVNWLAQQTYGQKQNRDNGSFKMIGGPIIRMTIGDMFFRMGGYIQSLAYDWNILGAGGKWEMTQGLRMPVACRVNITFRVLHDEMPNRDYNFYRGLMTNERILNGQGVIEGGGSEMQGFTVKGRGKPAKPLIPVKVENQVNKDFTSANPQAAAQATYSPDFDYYLKDLFYGRTSG